MATDLTTGNAGTEHTAEQTASLRSLSLARVEVDSFRSALPRGSHLRNFAVGCLSTYAQSRGLVGLDPTTFSAAHDLPGNLSRALIPTLLRDLGERGIIVKGVCPFDAYVGVFPSPLFVRAVLQDRSILHYVNPAERGLLDQLSVCLRDISRQEVERRWLSALGSAFLCVSPSSGLSVSNFSKSLPEFDGKDKRVGAVLAALHESEVITLATTGAQAEIFLSESLLERLEDRELVEKLRAPTRESILLPFVARERERPEEAVTNTNEVGGEPRPVVVSRDSKPVRRSLMIAANVKKEPSPVSSTDERREGNKAGREVRGRIVAVFDTATSLKMGELMTALKDLRLTDANVRYHVDLLCESGALARTGRGRGALISRVGGTRNV